MSGHYLHFSIKLKFLSELIAQQPAQVYWQNSESKLILSQTNVSHMKNLGRKNIHYVGDAYFRAWLHGKKN